MKDLGIALVFMLWAVILVATFGLFTDWLRNRRLKQWEACDKCIPLLIVQHTFWKAP